MAAKLLTIVFLILFFSTFVLIGLYFYYKNTATPLNKTVENTLDFVYKVASGGEKSYIPSGITLETVGEDGSYLYTLDARVINLDLTENSLLVETKAGKLLKFGIAPRITELGNNRFQLSVFERTVKNPSIKAEKYVFSTDDPDGMKKLFCDNTLVTITWTDKEPLNYWQKYLESVDSTSLIDNPDIILNFLRDYDTQGLFKTIDLQSSYICS